MVFPVELIQRVQTDYVGKKYKDGVYAFQNLESDTIQIVVASFLAWSEENGLIKENSLNIEAFLSQV